MRLLKKAGITLIEDPLPSDVRNGVPFQSATYPNGAEGTNENNAIVTTSVIQPPQAFVNAMQTGQFAAWNPYEVNLEYLGATFIDPNMVSDWIYAVSTFVTGGSYTPPNSIMLASNALPRANQIALLEAIRSTNVTQFEVDISNQYIDGQPAPLASNGNISLTLTAALSGVSWFQFWETGDVYSTSRLVVICDSSVGFPWESHGLPHEPTDYIVIDSATLAGWLLTNLQAFVASALGSLVLSDWSDSTQLSLQISPLSESAVVAAGGNVTLTLNRGYDASAIIGELATNYVTVYY